MFLKYDRKENIKMDKNISRLVYLLGGIILLGIVLANYMDIDDFINTIDGLFQSRKLKM